MVRWFWQRYNFGLGLWRKEIEEVKKNGSGIVI